MKQRKDCFLVGYMGRGQCVYGIKHYTEDVSKIADPMTLASAKKYLKQMPCKGAVIYKLTRYGNYISKYEEKN